MVCGDSGIFGCFLCLLVGVFDYFWMIPGIKPPEVILNDSWMNYAFDIYLYIWSSGTIQLVSNHKFASTNNRSKIERMNCWICLHNVNLGLMSIGNTSRHHLFHQDLTLWLPLKRCLFDGFSNDYAHWKCVFKKIPCSIDKKAINTITVIRIIMARFKPKI